MPRSVKIAVIASRFSSAGWGDPLDPKYIHTSIYKKQGTGFTIPLCQPASVSFCVLPLLSCTFQYSHKKGKNNIILKWLLIHYFVKSPHTTNAVAIGPRLAINNFFNRAQKLLDFWGWYRYPYLRVIENIFVVYHSSSTLQCKEQFNSCSYHLLCI